MTCFWGSRCCRNPTWCAGAWPLLTSGQGTRFRPPSEAVGDFEQILCLIHHSILSAQESVWNVLAARPIYVKLMLSNLDKLRFLIVCHFSFKYIRKSSCKKLLYTFPILLKNLTHTLLFSVNSFFFFDDSSKRLFVWFKCCSGLWKINHLKFVPTFLEFEASITENCVVLRYFQPVILKRTLLSPNTIVFSFICIHGKSIGNQYSYFIPCIF